MTPPTVAMARLYEVLRAQYAYIPDVAADVVPIPDSVPLTEPYDA